MRLLSRLIHAIRRWSEDRSVDEGTRFRQMWALMPKPNRNLIQWRDARRSVWKRAA